MIRHTVTFNLKYPMGSPEERDFLEACANLATLPGVKNFESLRQVSRKNDFTFGLSMEFASKAAYDGYSNHPDHTAFVETYWKKYVDRFLELDYELMG